jgi:hypothetical protein
MGNGIYFKIAGWVDLDMPHIFAILKLTFISCSFFPKKKDKKTNNATAQRKRIT